MENNAQQIEDEQKVKLPRLADLKAGDYFAVEGQNLYPKIMLDDGGYWDFHKQIYHGAPSPGWPCRQYTKEGVMEILQFAHNLKPEEAEDRVLNWPDHLEAWKAEVAKQ